MWFLRYLFRRELSLVDTAIIGTVSTGVFTGALYWFAGLLLLAGSDVIITIIQDLLQV